MKLRHGLNFGFAPNLYVINSYIKSGRAGDGNDKGGNRSSDISHWVNQN